jgi:hypothetical protein
MIDFSASWVGLCNRALARLGTTSIASLDDGSSAANYCNLLLPEALLSVYAEYDWKSAKKRLELAPLVDAPIYGYDYAFELPVDYIRIIHVDSIEPYSLEGNTILSDETSLEITYIARPEEATKIPGHLQALISTKLAFLLSTPMTSSEQLAQRLMSEYQMATQRAKEDDSRASYTEADQEWYDEVRG